MAADIPAQKKLQWSFSCEHPVKPQAAMWGWSECPQEKVVQAKTKIPLCKKRSLYSTNYELYLMYLFMPDFRITAKD